MFYNAPEGRAWTKAELPSILKEFSGRDKMIQRIVIYCKATWVGCGEVDMEPGVGRQRQLLRKIDSLQISLSPLSPLPNFPIHR